MYQIQTNYNIEEFDNPDRKPFKGNMLWDGEIAFHIKEKDNSIIFHWKDNDNYLSAKYLYNFLDTISFPIRITNREWEINKGVTSTDMEIKITVQQLLELFNTN